MMFSFLHHREFVPSTQKTLVFFTEKALQDGESTFFPIYYNIPDQIVYMHIANVWKSKQNHSCK